jgi:hypothetical protein
MPNRPGLIPIVQAPLPSDRVDGSRGGSRPRAWRIPLLRCRQQPQHEVLHVSRSGLVPVDSDDAQPTPPPQQVVSVAACARCRTTTCSEITQIPADRLYRYTGIINHQPRNRFVHRNHSPPARQCNPGWASIEALCSSVETRMFRTASRRSSLRGRLRAQLGVIPPVSYPPSFLPVVGTKVITIRLAVSSPL